MMKYVTLIVFFYSLIISPSLFSAQFNPGSNWTDSDGDTINAHAGCIVYSNGTYYWFGEKRTFGLENHGKVELYKSANLFVWHHVGTVLDLSSLEGQYSVERPKVIYNEKTKKYVMWLHIELHGKYNTGMAGVAISNKIDGEYKFHSQFYPNAGIKAFKNYYGVNNSTYQASADGIYELDLKKGQMFRDFTIFQDTDDKAYVIYESESNYSLQVAELDDTYTKLTGKYTRILIGGKNEAPIVINKNNKYYLITSGLNGFKPTGARLAISDNIFGPWVSIDEPVVNGSTHDIGTTFDSQGAFAFKIAETNNFIFVADRWNEKNLKDSTYIWLPVEWFSGRPKIKWYERWSY